MKYKIEKNTVQETLIIPLYARKMCSELYPELYRNETAQRLMDAVDYDFSALEKKSESLMQRFGFLEVAMRQNDLAYEVRAYLQSHPRAAVVNLGCGLDNTGRSCDNGTCRIYNVDFPDVIRVRNDLLPAGEREENIPCDLNDTAWFAKIDASEGAVFFAAGEMDIIAVPANLASVLYNNTDGAAELLAVNTLGVIYIVEKGESVQSVADLAGKTIYATGKGSTPEYALRYILSENGIDPDTGVTIEWKSEPTEVVGALSAAEEGIAMLPQPFVTVAQSSVEGLRVAIDLTEAWNALDNGSTLFTGVLVIRRDFAETYPEAIKAFLAEYEASTKYINENVADGAQLVEKYGIVKAAVAEKAIPYCNITYIAGEDMVAPMNGYLQVLFDQNPKSIGGAMPGEDFYYIP